MNLSVRQRLLVYLLSVTLLVWLAVAILGYLESRAEIEEVFDAQLVQQAKVLLLLSEHELYEELAFDNLDGSDTHPHLVPELLLKGNNHKYEQAVSFQIWLNSTYLAVRSANAPDYPMTDLINQFSYEDIEGSRWRVYALQDEDKPLLVQVGEKDEPREELATAISLRFLNSVLLALPILGVAIWFAVGSAMRPLNRIANEMSSRSLNYLEPVQTHPVPREAKPLVDALNSLFQRLNASIENERHFTADAAHELRTPLAALKTQAQVALRCDNDEARQQALRQVVRGVDRATHLVEQLLTLARLDPDSENVKSTVFTSVNPYKVAQETLADLVYKALEKSIDVSLSEPCKVDILCNVGMLSILIKNLVENAIRYTPEKGKVRVEIKTVEDKVLLQVSDSGSGIPDKDKDKVFKRFYRRLGHTQTGSGLGLSIVQRILEIHDTAATLKTSKYGGLLVEVKFKVLEPKKRS